ncbi:hypothetical protein EP7_002906 [Isosphaeraceae bacterium EP7]
MKSMARVPGSNRGPLAAALVVIGFGVVGISGCGEANVPKVKPGDPSTTYTVNAPPPDSIAGSAKPGKASKGTMSARELRDYRQKQKAGQ